jgi:hypothetical protein
VTHSGQSKSKIYFKHFQLFFFSFLLLIKNQETSDKSNFLSDGSSGDPRFVGDVPKYNVTYIYQNSLAPDPFFVLQIQNFINFFISTMFWLAFIPFHERLLPIFEPNKDGVGSIGFVDVPDFQVKQIYLGAFAPDTIAVQVKTRPVLDRSHDSSIIFQPLAHFFILFKIIKVLEIVINHKYLSSFSSILELISDDSKRFQLVGRNNHLLSICIFLSKTFTDIFAQQQPSKFSGLNFSNTL